MKRLKDNNITLIQTFINEEFELVDIFKNDTKIAYYNRLTDSNAFEIYYDYEDDDFNASYCFEDESSMIDFIVNVIIVEYSIESKTYTLTLSADELTVIYEALNQVEIFSNDRESESAQSLMSRIYEICNEI